tara:strand:- start:3967 stop:4407 length:441 start_codon:yes stop_codon:yes gene_type:complete
MTTKRESILAQIKTVLAGTAGGVGTRIYRERTTPISRGESPAIVIEPISDNPDQSFSLPRLDWSLSVRISIICRGSASSTPYEVADPIIESMHTKLLSDLTLNGHAIDIQPGNVAFEFVDSDQPALVVGADYNVRYRTLVTDLTSS